MFYTELQNVVGLITQLVIWFALQVSAVDSEEEKRIIHYNGKRIKLHLLLQAARRSQDNLLPIRKDKTFKKRLKNMQLHEACDNELVKLLTNELSTSHVKYSLSSEAKW
eukprot:Pgem_evm1s15532